jgi:hypothetical protein
LDKNLLTWISDPGVENSVSLFWSEVFFVVDAASQHLLAEGHDVRRFGLNKKERKGRQSEV